MTQLYADPANAVDIKPSMSRGAPGDVVEEKSPGVRRIEAISSCFTTWHKWMLYVSIFLVAYAYGLDGQVRYTYQSFATNSWGQLALISTVNVVTAVVAAAIQPPLAKISDYWGRISLLIISVIFYVVGTVVQAAATGVATYAGGAVIYQVGSSAIILLVVILIADTTSLRNRLVFSYIPALPFIINAWVSGNVTDAVIKHSTWRWGIGMWAIIFPVLTIPLFYCLISAEVRANRAGLLHDVPNPYKQFFSGSLWLDFFWQADVVGMLFLAATIALILLPFTLAGGSVTPGGIAASFKTAKIIAPLVIGVVIALPFFIVWESKFARHPLLPFRVFRKLAVCCAIGIAVTLNMAWYTQGDYLFTTLQVAFGKDVMTSTRVSNIYSFCSVIVGVILGLCVRWIRRVKPFVIAGGLLFILAFGLLIRYRGGHSNSDFAGLVAAEVVLGIAGGFVPYTTQAAIQAEVAHERTALVTGLFLAAYNIGSGIGNTIAGGIWTNTMPGHILTNLNNAGVADAETVAVAAYGSPLTWILENPLGTPAREAVDLAFRQVQRYLTIAGISLSCLLVIFALGLKNRRLGDTQSLDNIEKDSVHAPDSEEDSHSDHTASAVAGPHKAVPTQRV